MELIEVVEIATTILVSLGGAGVIFWRVSAYFVKIFADKYMETMKKEFQKEIEEYKSKLELSKQTKLRYSTQQFELYSNLWRSLCRLKVAANSLWDEPCNQNLIIYSKLLREAIGEVEQGSLFLEDKHYLEMHELLDEFGQDELGEVETRIVKFHGGSEVVRPEVIALWTKQNLSKKERYEKLMEEIREELKVQMRGD